MFWIGLKYVKEKNIPYAFPHKIISLVNKQLLSLNAGLSLFDVLR
jgi:hypothetical protein